MLLTRRACPSRIRSGIAEMPPRRLARLLEWHALGMQLVGAFSDVEVELALDVAIDAA